MWWRWENNRNVAVVVYSFTIYEALLKKKLSVGSMWGRCRVHVGSMWSWMENTYNKLRKRRENDKIEGK